MPAQAGIENIFTATAQKLIIKSMVGSGTAKVRDLLGFMACPVKELQHYGSNQCNHAGANHERDGSQGHTTSYRYQTGMVVELEITPVGNKTKTNYSDRNGDSKNQCR